MRLAHSGICNRAHSRNQLSHPTSYSSAYRACHRLGQEKYLLYVLKPTKKLNIEAMWMKRKRGNISLHYILYEMKSNIFSCYQLQHLWPPLRHCPICDSLRLWYEWEEAEGVIFSCQKQGQGYIPTSIEKFNISWHKKKQCCSEQSLQIAVAVCHWPNCTGWGCQTLYPWLP